MDLVAALRRTSQLTPLHRYDPLRCLRKRAPAEEGKRLSGIRLSSAHMQVPEADCPSALHPKVQIISVDITTGCQAVLQTEPLYSRLGHPCQRAVNLRQRRLLGLAHSYPAEAHKPTLR